MSFLDTFITASLQVQLSSIRECKDPTDIILYRVAYIEAYIEW